MVIYLAFDWKAPHPRLLKRFKAFATSNSVVIFRLSKITMTDMFALEIKHVVFVIKTYMFDF